MRNIITAAILGATEANKLFALNALKRDKKTEAPARVAAIDTNTDIFKNGVYLATLGAGEVYTKATFKDHDVISSDKPIYGVSKDGANEHVMIPEAFKGKKFAVSNHRRTPMMVWMQATGKDIVECTTSTAPEGSSVLIPPAGFNYTTTKKAASWDCTDDVVIAVGAALSTVDFQPVPPVATKWIGVPSTHLEIAQGAKSDGLQVSMACHGYTHTFTVPHVDVAPYKMTKKDSRFLSQYRGQACTFTANKPFYAGSMADGDGGDSTPFLPYEDNSFLSTKFVTPDTYEFITFAAGTNGGKKVMCQSNRRDDFSIDQGDGTGGVHKRRIGKGQGGEVITCDGPVYAVMELKASNDEQIFYGAVENMEYIAPSQSPTASPTSSPTQSPTASPTSSPTASPTSSPTNVVTSKTHMELGAIKQITHDKENIAFNAPFENDPVVFANAITYEGEQPVTTKINSITKNGISNIFLQEPKDCNGRKNEEHTKEQLDWMALEPGRYGDILVGRFTSTQTSSRVDFGSENHFDSDKVVVLVAVQQDVHNNKFKLVRVTETSKTGFGVLVQQEEGSSALKGAQKTVVIGWMAMLEGNHILNGYELHARAVQTETGDRLKTIALENHVGTDLPLIFGNIGSLNGADPAFIRIIKKGLSNGKFQLLVDEDDCLNDEKEHMGETLFVITVNPEQKFHIEFGEFTSMDHNAIHVPFKLAYRSTPVFFANAITYKGEDPVVTKLQSVTRTGVNNVRLVEPVCGRYDQKHFMPEQMDWMALNAGEYIGVDPYGTETNYDGVKIGRGTITGNGLGEIDIKFENSFSTDEIAVILTVQGDNTEQWKTARSYNVNREGFTLRVDVEEGKHLTANEPTVVGYMAMQLGAHVVDGYTFKAEKVRTSTTMVREHVEMENHHGSDVPLIFASIGSFDGTNPSIVRIHKAPTGHFKTYQVFIDEEQCSDDEQEHVPETIFVVTVNPTQNLNGQYQVMSEASHSAHAFWSAGPLRPGMFPSECNPADCGQWSCKTWCSCFEYPQVQDLFEGDANTPYSAKISEICPDDDEETCDCGLSENGGSPRVDRKYIK